MEKKDLLQEFRKTVTSSSKNQAFNWCERRGMFDNSKLILSMRNRRYVFDRCIELGFNDNISGKNNVRIMREYDNFAIANGIDLCEGVSLDDPKECDPIDMITVFREGYRIIADSILDHVAHRVYSITKEDVDSATKEFVSAYNLKKKEGAAPLDIESCRVSRDFDLDKLKEMWNDLYIK